MTDRPRLTVEWVPGLAGPDHPVPLYRCPCGAGYSTPGQCHRCPHPSPPSSSEGPILEGMASAGTSRGNRYGAQGGGWVHPDAGKRDSEWEAWKAERDRAVAEAEELAANPGPEQLGLEL